MLLSELLEQTADEAATLAKTADADTQAHTVGLLSKIKSKDYKGLIKHLTKSQSIDCIQDDYENYRQLDVTSLSNMVNTVGKSLTLSALVAATIVIQSVSAGDTLDLKFPKKLEEAVHTHEVLDNDREWLTAQVDELTDSKLTVTVSTWAEEKRFLPRQVTPMPGFYSYTVTPFLREIADCMSIDSPVQEIDFMKAAQVGATVGILENTIGYIIDHVKSAPAMLLTADAELALLRVELYITPMLQHSDLMHLIQSSDEGNSRKTGKTNKKIEWAGGGFLVPFGAKNADKLRSTSIQYLLQDECDAFPDTVGKDGDPQKLVEARTKAYHESRKIARISTPLITGRSRIARGYERGDQRKFFVPCKACKEMQVLEFQGRGEKTYGLIWELDEEDILVEDSVRYVCKFCGHLHRNADKMWMLPRGEWRPTSRSRNPVHRSYHLSALYSPIGMFPWEGIVLDWLEAWDTKANRVRDVSLLQEFYNNNLGIPFTILGDSVKFVSVSGHRRQVYKFGNIPNKYALQYSGSFILFLTCQVDVHKSNLAVTVMGWTRDFRCYVIDYWRFEVAKEEDDCNELSSPVWARLREVIEEREYKADDGKTYKVAITLVDAGYANDTVTTFCADYASGVYPILGRDRPAKNQSIREFAEFTTQSGTVGYRILVDHYKDRIATILRREWVEASGDQKPYHFNAPLDVTKEQLTELTVERRVEKKDERGNSTYAWIRRGNAKNELWDLLVYGHAAVEILAWSICIQHFELDTIDWPRFWDFIEKDKLYYKTS